MKTAFYAGASGLIAQQQAMNVIANNLANVNTTGYQAQNDSFESLLYTQMYANTNKNPLSGSGIRSVSTGLQFGQGTVRSTDFMLDFTIIGDGMFAVQNGNQVEYTRDGTFGISLVGNQAYLTTQDGCYVLDQNGDRIAIPKKQGTDDYDYGALKEQVGMFRFDYPSALSPISNNRYLPTEQSGNAEKAGLATSKLMQGFLENSGTNMMDEMTQMIAAQRAFQMSGRVVQTADEIEQIVNNLRK